MREAPIISELRAALRRNGVWGARAERLMKEWTDHARDDAARRVEEGAAPEVARDAAWKALGSPDVLAAASGRELARASWEGRHPWLAGLVLPAFAWFALAMATLFLPVWIAWQFFEIEALERSHPAALLAALRCWQAVINWLPWLLSMAWLARIAVRMPGGWKHFWITAVVLTLFSTSFWMTIEPPLHGPNSGTLMVYASGILGVIFNAFFHLIGYGPVLGPWSVWARNTTPCWIQTAIMLFGAISFYRKATATRTTASAAPAG
jgi:hypothetical protein